MYYLNLLESKKRVKRIMNRNKHYYDLFESKYIEKESHMLRKTHKRCSCYACGNPRKYFGSKTKQEILNDIKIKEELTV